jgi:hypothetical protein
LRATIQTAFWIATIVVVLGSGPATAQGRYNLMLTATGGVGGSIDEDAAGFGNSAFQLGLLTELNEHSLLALRVGRLSFGTSDTLGSLADPSVDYATVGGEYRYDEGAYTSGLFLGLGAYRLSGLVGGSREDETAIGVNLGASGIFDINRRVSVVAEISAHLLNADFAEILVLALGGVAIHI